jgi:hypothetical protein
MADFRRRMLRFAAVPAVLALAAPIPACGQADARALPAVEGITGDRIAAHLQFLASDELRGRDTPSPGLEAAAEYLASQHQANGLDPAGDGGEYLQRFPYRLSAPDPGGAEIAIVGPNGRAEPVVGEDAFFEGGSANPISAPLTYVPDGAAIPAGSLTGRVAVFDLPGSWGEALWLTSLEQATLAGDAGAVAVVHVLDVSFPQGFIGQIMSALAAPIWRLAESRYPPRIFVRGGGLAAAIPPVAFNGGASAPQPIDGASLEARLPLGGPTSEDPANVLALLPGRDPELRDEYIVLTAHYDHVGVGIPVAGDSIYNGADDNASGTSALLEVARSLAALPPQDRPRRSVLFLHVSAEEKGLLGSQWWVENPTVPIDAVVANVNLDMVAGNTHPDTIAVLGLEYSSLGATILDQNEAHAELGLAAVPDMWPEEGLFFRSDQLNFMRRDIPALFFFAGFHDCYHRPCDEVDFVSADKAARVARLVAYTILDVANRTERPSWTPGGLDEVRRMITGGG